MRKLALFSAAFAAACAAAQYLPAGSWILPAALCCALMGLGGLLLRGNARLCVFLLAAGLSLGLLRVYAHERLVLAPNERLAGTTGTFTLEVWDYPTKTNYGGARIEVRAEGLPGRAVFYGDGALMSCVPGERITVRAQCADARRLGDEDEPAMSTFSSKGIYLLLYARGEAEVTHVAPALRHLPRRIAHRMSETIGQSFPAREAGFFRALLLGDKTGLAVADQSDLQEAGLFHITAVSGLHCGFLIALLGALVGRERRRLLSAVGIPALLLYALVAGATPSVLRACVMLSMQLLAPLLRRENDAPTSMACALLLILLWNPCAAASISLQLSFAAVSGLLWLTPRLTARLSGKGRLVRVVGSSLAATAGALVFSAPLSACYFGFFVLVVPLSNMLCLWAASLAFMLALPVTAAAALVPAAGVLAALPLLPARYLLAVAHALASLPYHAMYFTDGICSYWMVYVYALFGVCLLGRRPKRSFVLAGVLSAASLALVLWLNAASYSCGTMQAAVLDVGQGQSVFLTSQGASALVDCGSSNTWYAAGGTAADYLISAGVHTLDCVIVTHYHADHTNGLEELFARVRVKTLLLPDIPDEDGTRGALTALAARYGTETRFLTRETALPFGAAALTVYPPVGAGSANERGLSVLCTAGEFDLLITGDMDSATEKHLIAAFALPDIEALVVGHHGSKGSTGRELLQTVTPEVGVISVGRNSYGHPTDAALWRLDEAGVAVYRTDRQGSVRIIVQ